MDRSAVSVGSVGRMFSALAPRYQTFNRWSSLGLDGVWRRRLLRSLGGAGRVLDLGTGTGDLAGGIAGHGPETKVVGMDLSFDMLTTGRRCFSPDDGPSWVQGSGDRLPFRNGTFDAVVSAFVLRNLFLEGVLGAALEESVRVLKPGGRVVFLDLTRPQNTLVRWGHVLYCRTLLPLLGKILFREKWPGSYLARSIQALPPGESLGSLFRNRGFSSFECRPLWGGIVSLFIGEK